MGLTDKPAGQLQNLIDGQYKEIGNAHIFSCSVTCPQSRIKLRSKILIIILRGIITVDFLDPGTVSKVAGQWET